MQANKPVRFSPKGISVELVVKPTIKRGCSGKLRVLMAKISALLPNIIVMLNMDTQRFKLPISILVHNFVVVSEVVNL